MRKIIYYITVIILCIIGVPFMIFCKDKWNRFGRKVDGFFGIDSRPQEYTNKNMAAFNVYTNGYLPNNDDVDFFFLLLFILYFIGMMTLLLLLIIIILIV